MKIYCDMRMADMRTIFFIMAVCSLVFTSASFADNYNTEAQSRYFGDIALDGKWHIRDDSQAVKTGLSIEKLDSPAYFVYSGELPKKRARMGFGGTLNLKYFSGMDYDYLKNNLPGKTISADIFIPKESISSNDAVPNRIRFSVKSYANGKWAEYYGASEWISVRESGKVSVSLKIPDSPVKTPDGKTFYPDSIMLVSIEYYSMEGGEHIPYVAFYFSNFKIEQIGLDPDELRWQSLRDGYAAEGEYLRSMRAGSTFITSMEKDIELKYKYAGGFGASKDAKARGLEDVFLVLPISVPMPLCGEDGIVTLTIKGPGEEIFSSTRELHSCNSEGKIFLTIALDGPRTEEWLEGILNKSLITLDIQTPETYTAYMLPIVVEPLTVRYGSLIPFDAGWKIRDIQGLGGYGPLKAEPGALTTNGGNIAVKELADGLYEMDLTVKLKGGIDWENPLFRVELLRDFEGGSIDLDGAHIEVLVSPLTDTAELWQKPYRARIGILDSDGAVMLGPNVSLSEGLPSIASLDVSLTNPIPKGFVMPGFDPKNSKALIINFEATPAEREAKNLKIILSNLSISRRHHHELVAPKKIDFSRFKRDPASWAITRAVKDSGGYLVGLNYPFPVVPVPKDILEVPQVYPCVGRKSNDPMHLGFSSEITRDTMVKDLKEFAASDIALTRLIILGHLDGVFKWDERGRDIKGFSESSEKMLKEASMMDVEQFAKFLGKNDKNLFGEPGKGYMPGLEKHVMDDFTALLDIFEEVEKETGKRIIAILSLYDFLMADNIKAEGPGRIYRVGEHPEVVTDPLIKTKANALIWKIMKTLGHDKRFVRYVAAVEIMNEPENATALATKDDFTALVNFVGEGLYLLKDALPSSVPVSVGFRSWPGDLKYWATISDGIDILMPHYWESLESYNIDLPGFWPLDMPSDRLWQYLGTEKNGRLTGIGEISPGGKLAENLERIKKGGYDFALVWSYSGHDGFDAKPFMAEIKNYQKKR